MVMRASELAGRCRSIEAALEVTRIEHAAAVAEVSEQARLAADAQTEAACLRFRQLEIQVALEQATARAAGAESELAFDQRVR